MIEDVPSLGLGVGISVNQNDEAISEGSFVEFTLLRSKSENSAPLGVLS